jgi:histidinol phosphatase-like enzyme
MEQTFNDRTKQIADALIDMSAKLAAKMDAWHNIVVGEGSMRNTDRAGFVNKTSSDSGIDFLIDIQAPANGNEAVLRTWAIESFGSEDGVKLFNNIQLTFTVTYEKARQLTERFDTVTREDIRSLLHESDTELQSVVISNQSGLSESDKTTYGKRYDVTANDIVEQDLKDEICGELEEVLRALQNNADTEIS